MPEEIPETKITITRKGGSRILNLGPTQIFLVRRSELEETIHNMLAPSGIPTGFKKGVILDGLRNRDEWGNDLDDVSWLRHEQGETPSTWKAKVSTFVQHVADMEIVRISYARDLTVYIFLGD
ncbi:MAG TPA: hypothetical protein VLA04_01225 [Verrucomicrobiae bacterium]|nr:hypothetical protein [Verrucomicrobiae bacterium]